MSPCKLHIKGNCLNKEKSSIIFKWFSGKTNYSIFVSNAGKHSLSQVPLISFIV